MLILTDLKRNRLCVDAINYFYIINIGEFSEMALN